MPSHTTLAAFKVSYAKALMTLHGNNERRNGPLAYLLGDQDLPMPQDTDPGADATFEVTEPGPDDLVDGYGNVKRSELSAEALEERDAEELRRYRRRAYDFLRNQVAYGHWTLDAVRPHLEALDLLVPVPQTYVSGTIYSEDGAGTRISVIVKGEVSRDTALTALEGRSAGSRERQTAIALFGEDQIISGLPSKVTDFRHSVEHVWPESDEIDATEDATAGE